MIYDIVKKEIDFNEFKRGIKILNFHAVWCGPCRLMKETFNELSEKGYTIYRVDVDQDKEYTSEMEIKGTPTTFIYLDGKIVETLVGYKATDEILDVIKNLK